MWGSDREGQIGWRNLSPSHNGLHIFILAFAFAGQFSQSFRMCTCIGRVSGGKNLSLITNLPRGTFGIIPVARFLSTKQEQSVSPHWTSSQGFKKNRVTSTDSANKNNLGGFKPPTGIGSLTTSGITRPWHISTQLSQPFYNFQKIANVGITWDSTYLQTLDR